MGNGNNYRNYFMSLVQIQELVPQDWRKQDILTLATTTKNNFAATNQYT